MFYFFYTGFVLSLFIFLPISPPLFIDTTHVAYGRPRRLISKVDVPAINPSLTFIG